MHPFAEYVKILGRGKNGSRSLSFAEAKASMAMILNDETEELQLGAFLMLLRVKEESPEEMAGFVAACREAINTPKIQVDIDWSSYAGKRRHLPWFILSALAMAQSGIRIFIHGAAGHTPDRVYTEHVFEQLILPVANNFNDANALLNKHNICYMNVEHILPKLDYLIQLKPILGLRSPANSFVRMINPFDASLVMQGIFHPAYNGIHQQACSLLNYKNVCVIKGDGGEIERNPEMELTSYQVVNGIESEQHWPIDLEKRELKPAKLTVSELINVWQGKQHTYGERAVITTIAVTIASLEKLDQAAALQRANEIWLQRNKNSLG